MSCRYQWADFKNRYSEGVMAVLFEGYDFTFNPKNFINTSVFKSSCFNAEYDKYSGEDLLTVKIPNDDGTPSNVLMTLSDLHVTKQEQRRYRCSRSC